MNRPFREYKKKRKYTEHKANAVCHENSSDSDSEGTGLIICQDAFSVGKESDGNSDWIVDSGASAHICNNENSFVSLNSLDESQDVIIGDGRALKAIGLGVVRLSKGEVRTCNLHVVLFVPELAYNLLSVSRATTAGKVKFYEDDCVVSTSSGREVIMAKKCKFILR